jgi:hypothetical protein
MIAPQGLSTDQQIEYQEIGEFVRHDDTVDLAMSSVLLPLLVSAIVAAWTEHQFAIPLAFGSFLVWLYWYSVKKRRMDFLLVRLDRARELERIGQLDHHLRLRREDIPTNEWGHLNSLIRIRRAESYVSIGLFWAWFFLFFLVAWMPALVTAGGVAVLAVIAVVTDSLEAHRRGQTYAEEWPRLKKALTRGLLWTVGRG